MPPRCDSHEEIVISSNQSPGPGDGNPVAGGIIARSRSTRFVFLEGRAASRAPPVARLRPRGVPSGGSGPRGRLRHLESSSSPKSS